MAQLSNIFSTPENNRKMNGNILLSSVSNKAAWIRVLKDAAAKMGNDTVLFCGDADSRCVGQYLGEPFWHMPQDGELTRKMVLHYCRENQIHFIIPSRDGELLFWALHKKWLRSKQIFVMVSDEPVIRRTQDKLAFSRFLAAENFPVIPSATRASTIDADRLVVKEQFGAGSKGIGINLSHDAAERFSSGLENPIFQPMIVGTEYSIDAYVSIDKKCIATLCRSRDLTAHGESQISTTVRHPKIEYECKQMAESLGLYGHVVFQVIEDELEQIHVVECNARFGGASSLGYWAGLTGFFWFLQESTGQTVTPDMFQRVKGELRQVRYPEDLLIPCEPQSILKTHKGGDK